MGTNFVNAFARLGIPRMLQLTPRNRRTEAAVNVPGRLRVKTMIASRKGALKGRVSAGGECWLLVASLGSRVIALRR